MTTPLPPPAYNALLQSLGYVQAPGVAKQFQPWDYTANDLRLIELAMKMKRELDEAEVPDDDPRRVFHVTRETADDWERRGGRWTEIAGLKIRVV